MKAAVLLGVFLGALAVADPLVSSYLLRDFSFLRHLPYLLSITLAVSIGMVFAMKAFVPGIIEIVVQDYYRYFPPLFLLAYQLNAVALGALDPTEVVIGVFVLLFLAGLFIRRDQYFVSTPFNALHLALAVCFAVSLASQFKPFSFLKGFKPLVVFFLMINFLPRGNLIQTFLRWLVILAVLSSAFALVQEAAWLSTQTMITMIPAKDLKLQIETHFGVPMFRVPAMTAGYPILALYLAAALLVSVSALLWRQGTRLLRPGWLIVALCFICPALFLTFSKPVLIGCGAGLLLLLLMRWPTRVVGVLLAGGLVGALGLFAAISIVPGNVDTAVEQARTIPKTEQERIRLDRDSIEGFLHGPYFWTGRGIGAGKRYTAHVRQWPAHNSFILTAAELGVPGLVIYLMVYGLAVARAVALNIVVRSGAQLFIVRALPAILLVDLVQAQFTADNLDTFVWVIFATAEALWFQARQPRVATADPVANSFAV